MPSVGFADARDSSQLDTPTNPRASYVSTLRPNASFRGMTGSRSRVDLAGSMSAASMESLLHDRALFDTLAEDDSLNIEAFVEALQAVGLTMDDPRLTKSKKILDSKKGSSLSFEEFSQVVGPSAALIETALSRQLTVTKWEAFVETTTEVFEATAPNVGGQNAQYIPELKNADPEVFGMSFCSIDGQKLNLGECDTVFSIQSASKPLSYLLALQEHGESTVHRFVGREPSGQNFNELCLNSDNIPHNPMINSGAIMVCSLIGHNQEPSARFGILMDMWQDLTANHHSLGFSNTTYLSESASANRNFCLGYMMQEKGAFKHGKDKTKAHRDWRPHHLGEALDLYFQQCSIELNVEACSVVAATLANGGVNPFTKKRVFSADYVRNGLSLMLSCGMYDYSGEWAYLIGLPAKSGVSGVVLLVVPNVGGYAIHSPRLDDIGNSVRGVAFCKILVQKFALTLDDQLAAMFQKNSGLESEKLLVHNSRGGGHKDVVAAMCNLACSGDLEGLRAMVACGHDINGFDYDGRSPLHLAASEGHLHIAQYLVFKGVEINPVDRMGGTPLSDARREGHEEVEEFLLQHGAQEVQQNEQLHQQQAIEHKEAVQPASQPAISTPPPSQPAVQPANPQQFKQTAATRQVTPTRSFGKGGKSGLQADAGTVSTTATPATPAMPALEPQFLM